MTNERMYCGNCGYGKVTLRAIYDGDRHFLTEVRVRCCNCKSVTRLVLSAPTICVEWGKNADGLFVPGWGPNHKPPKRQKGAAK